MGAGLEPQRNPTADKKHAILLALQAWYFGRDSAAKSTNEIAHQIGVDGGYLREILEQQGQVVGSHNLPARVIGKQGLRRGVSRTLERRLKGE